MTSHRLFNIFLVVAISITAGVIGPALDDPHETPAQVARAALAAGDAEGHERLARLCHAKLGSMAEVRWAEQGPYCHHASAGGRAQ